MDRKTVIAICATAIIITALVLGLDVEPLVRMLGVLIGLGV